MKTSKNAKRRFTAWNQAMWKSPKNQRYMMSRANLISLEKEETNFAIDAAKEAMQILLNNRRKADAKLQTVPNVEGNPVTPDTQGSPEHGVHSEQEAGTGSKEGGPFGAFGSGQ
jgi:hypothetical protein